MSDIIGSKDFSTIKPFAFWTQHVLPLVYGDEISYMETLDKVVKLLNELIKNNNKLPDYIQKIVEEYITGGPLEEVLSVILANFILNVKYPPTGITPAKGDGTVNDYEAIQGCIDYAANNGGGVVYFPFGKYLTSKLILKPGVSLMGFGKYCTNIVLTGGETGSLISGTVNDCGIYNLTLDGNMSIQVNNVDVVTLTGYNIQLMNVILTDGYTLFNIEKTGDNIEINNVEFRYAVESMIRIGGTAGSVNADNVTFGSLSTINGVAAIISDSDNDVITGIVSNKVLPLFAELDGNNNVLKGRVVSDNLIKGDGQNNIYDFYGKSKDTNYSGDVSESVNGNKSVHISGMSTFAVDGTKSEIVTGVSRAEYKEDRTIIGKNISETLTGKKSVKALDLILNPLNPLTYKTPVNETSFFDSIPMKDLNGNEYSVLVKTNNTALLFGGSRFVDNVTDLKNSNLSSGFCTVLGYNTPGDNIPILYEIKDTGVENGGTVIKLANNKYAHAIFVDGGVTPETFGIFNSLPREENISKWNTYLNAVNGNNELWFLLLGHEYYVYTPLIIKKSLIGVSNSPYSSTLKAMYNIPVVSPTSKTLNGYTQNHSCIVYLYRGNSYEFTRREIEIANVRIDCNKLCECGIFETEGDGYNIHNVFITNSTLAGAYFMDVWSSSASHMTILVSSPYGLVVGPLDDDWSGRGGGTTFNLSNCTVNEITNETGLKYSYRIRGLAYSMWDNISTDYVKNATNMYYLRSCGALTINGCGVENSTVSDSIWYLENCRLSIGAFNGSTGMTAPNMFHCKGSGTLTVGSLYTEKTYNGLFLFDSAATWFAELCADTIVSQNNTISDNSSGQYIVVFKRGNFYGVASNSNTFKSLLPA